MVGSTSWMSASDAASELDYLQQRVRELEGLLSTSHGRSLAGSDKAFRTTVFSLGTDISLFVVPVVMLSCIALTVAVEKLVHLAHHIPEAYLPLVHKLEEEFMIMGAVSFVLVIIEFSAGISHDLLLNIEFAHLLLFFAAISLVCFALRTLVSTNACQKRRLPHSELPSNSASAVSQTSVVISRANRLGSPRAPRQVPCARGV